MGKGAGLRQLESRGTFWEWASLLQTKTSPTSVYVASPKGQSGERDSQMEFILIFLFSERRTEGGASQAQPGLGPQWNLPELVATPGSAGCWSERRGFIMEHIQRWALG